MLENYYETEPYWNFPVEEVTLKQAETEGMNLDHFGITEYGDYRMVRDAEAKERIFAILKNKKAITIPHETFINCIDDVATLLWGENTVTNLKAISDGAGMFTETFCPPEHDIKLGGEIIKLRILGFNFYTSKDPIVRIGYYRTVCSNGMISPIVEKGFKGQILHKFITKKQDDMARIILSLIKQNEEILTAKWKEWKDVEIPFQVAVKALEKLHLPKKINEVYLENPSLFPISKMQWYNDLTRKTTHDIESELTQLRVSEMIANIFYSDKSLLSEKEIKEHQEKIHENQRNKQLASDEFKETDIPLF